MDSAPILAHWWIWRQKSAQIRFCDINWKKAHKLTYFGVKTDCDHFWGSIVILGWPLYTISKAPKNHGTPPPCWQCQYLESDYYSNLSLIVGWLVGCVADVKMRQRSSAAWYFCRLCLYFVSLYFCISIFVFLYEMHCTGAAWYLSLGGKAGRLENGFKPAAQGRLTAALPDRDLLHQLRPRRTLILAVILHPVHFQGDIEPLGHFQTKIHISDSESPRNKIAQVCFQIKPCPCRCYSTARV